MPSAKDVANGSDKTDETNPEGTDHDSKRATFDRIRDISHKSLEIDDLDSPQALRSSSVSPRTQPILLTREREGSISSQDSDSHVLAQSWHPTSNPKAKLNVDLRYDPDILKNKSASIAAPPSDEHAKLQRSVSQPTSVRRASDNSISNFNKFTKNYIIPAAKWAYSPISGNKTKKEKEFIEYHIEYSVFRPLRHLKPVRSAKDFIIHWRKIVEDETGAPFDYPENYYSGTEFNNLLNNVIDLIEIDGLYPQRIAAGSSGSYFIENKKTIAPGNVKIYKVGVFKPKDEEPYGPLSPKWTKWLHRTFFPCFFGRSCLIPNLGYISEAAACVLDRQLLSYIVPFTDVVYLRSPTFYYSYWNSASNVSKLPKKIGSFQVFLNGYSEAISWFRQHPIPNDVSILPLSSEITVPKDSTDLDSKFVWSQSSIRQFQEELEKLVILDYIMRNTDRGLDNWMIKINWKVISEDEEKKTKSLRPFVKIGAIDSGLAFPWKQPDEWRSFPFGWLFLPLSVIGQPFSLRTRNHYLPLLTSKYWWEQTVTKLRKVFEMDNDFKERMWLKQLAVIKGQAFNVVEILKLSYAGPLELTRRENLEIIDDITYLPDSNTNDSLLRAMQSSVFEITPNGASNGYTPYGKSSDEEVSPVTTKADDRTPLLPAGQIVGKTKLPISRNYLDSIDETRNELAASSEAAADISNGNKIDSLNGFEYNLKHCDSLHNSGIQRVVIERLVKTTNSPPVFTWC
ncbi:phosphatidyl inositol kinase [Scheffersomyces xylosifermentans]|uniref:phosphatidyl inositol kinase n=1 Tax=Scheffersomyces xylosifermentans TaxID=1304137 RepID=UPI00315DC463